jgi:L-fucose isomerase-like protein
MSAKVKIGLTGISFPPFWGFTASQYRRRVGEFKKLAASLGATVAATPATFQDAAAGIAAAEALNRTDLAVLDVATYPEGKAALSFFDALKVPLVLWSRDESEHGTHIGHNSFCGANFLGGNLALKGRRFRSIYGPTTDKNLVARLRTAVILASAAKRARGATIGLFGGGIVPKFHDIDIQPADRQTLEERYDIRFVGVDTEELVKLADSYCPCEIEDEATDFASNFASVNVDRQAMLKQARLLRAMRELTEKNGFASIAIRCWPELQTTYGAWPCPSIGVLNEAGVPTACEGDPGGALDMLLASKLTPKPTTLLDIVDWDARKDTLTIWHCGPTARSWAGGGKVSLLPHNVDGRTKAGTPACGLPGIVDMQFAPGAVTVFRTLGALDDEFVFQGQVVPAGTRAICGSFGVVGKMAMYGRSIASRDVRDQIFARALPHHYTAARGHLFY